MRAEIITIGDELLIGQVVDTNSAWMAERLNEVGISLHQITSVHDNREHILKALDEAFSRADLVFTTGGLGPTKDDITKHVMCEYFGTSLVEDSHVRAHVHELYKDRPEALNRLTATQWLVPASATILPNRVGSAPIMVFEQNTTGEADLQRSDLPSTAQRSKYLIALPGVPHEMKIAMTEQVLPYIGTQQSYIGHQTLQVYGISESALAIQLEQYEASKPDYIHLAYLPKDGVIRLRLSSYGQATESELNQWFEQLQTIVAPYLIATTDLPLECVLGALLQQKNQTIATAESCTGGKLAALLSKHSGSSAFYKGSVISYANSVKRDVLGVSDEILNTHGAVSEETVIVMANSIREQLGADYGIAISGIAGPTGGTLDKPVGTVWMAWATPTQTIAECVQLGKLREQITDRACQKAMIKLIQLLR